MIVVGADAHVRNSFLHATDETGKLLVKGRFANLADDLKRFCADGGAQSDCEMVEPPVQTKAIRCIRATAIRSFIQRPIS